MASSVTVVLILAGAALFAVAPLWREPPLPTTGLALPASAQIPGTAPALPWPGVGQAALEIDGMGRSREAGLWSRRVGPCSPGAQATRGRG